MLRRPITILVLLMSIWLVVPAGLASASQGYPVAGTVLDAVTGQPLAGFAVTLSPDKGGSAQTVHASANGQFNFSTVAQGKYILSGSGPGYRAQGLNQHGNYFTGIAVGPKLDATNIVFRLLPDASIRGQVVDEQNEPVRNATAQLFRMDDEDGVRRAVSLTNAGTTTRATIIFRIWLPAPTTSPFRPAPGMRNMRRKVQPTFSPSLTPTPQLARSRKPLNSTLLIR